MHKLVFLVIAFLSASAALAQQPTFHNPLLLSGPDPWIIADQGFYHYTNSTGSNITLWKTRDITDLAHAEEKVVWIAPATGPYSRDIWAPELHRFDNKWYLYFAADSGRNEDHRLFVLENPNPDPLTGDWTMKGQLDTIKWAIDATAFEDHGQKYILWSGWQGDTDGEQRIYIARLKNPWTIDNNAKEASKSGHSESGRVELSHPQYPWEQVGDLPNRPAIPHVNVNEGPEILQHNDDIFLVYSASACWTDYYELGVLRAKSGSDLLNPASWHKYDHPFFQQDREAQVFGPGHNGFFRTPSGQDWIIYHANPQSGEGCGQYRSPRIQPFTWNPDGTPNFGKPLPTTTPIPKPE